jgi:PKD repeat protein
MNVSDFNTALNIPATACVGESVQFFDNSTVGANSWSWSATAGAGVTGVGNFNTANSQNPFAIFTAPGQYTINLTSSNTAVPCFSSATGTITINPLPTDPSFTLVQNAECAPATVTFTNTTPSPGGLTFVWNFGNGSPTFTGENPAPQVYTGNGYFTPCFTATNTSGCSASFCGTPVVLSSPVANFTVDLKDGCAGQNIQFTDNSTTTPTITSWQWNFGDGSPVSTQQNPTHTFICGIYDVTLIIAAGTCRDTVRLSEGAIPAGAGYQTSTAGAQNLLLKYGTNTVPNFTLDHRNDCIKKPFELEDVTNIFCPHEESDIIRTWFFNSVPDGSGLTHTKTFSDTMQNVSAENGLPGTDIWLEINFRGCKDTTMRFNQIYISGPVSKFSVSQTLFCDINQQGTPLNKSITINDSESIYGHQWLDNTVPLNPQILDSTVANLAFDDVKVTYRWGDGTSNFVEDDDTFLEDHPNKGGTVNPANTTLTPTTLADPVTGQLSHAFTQYGTFQVWQIIENFNSLGNPISPNQSGCKDSSMVTVNVSWISTDYVFDEAPLATNLFDDLDSVCINSPFSMIPRPEAPNTAFTFTGQVLGQAVNHGPVTHNFTSNTGFSGASGTNSSISTPGIYPITLTTSNAVGCSTTAVGEMTAFDLPVASFTLTAVQGCVGVPYNTNPVNSSSHPAGSYTLGANNTGWSATNGFNWSVNGVPVAGSPSGDYNFSPVTVVNQNTTYTLVVQDAFGCTSAPFSASAIVQQPTAGLSIANTVCNSDIPNGVINFEGNGNIATYQWIIDGVSLPASTSSSISFPSSWEITDPTITSATHEVGLIVVDVDGCSDTLDNPGQFITIVAPQANFTDVITTTSLPIGNGNEYFCPPVVVNFNDASISSGSPISSWFWQIGTITSADQNPQGIQFLYPGVYDLRMVIYAGGCIDTLSIDDYLIIHGPSAEPIIMSNADICGQSVTFDITNLINVASWSWNLGDGTTVTSNEEPDNNFIYQYPGVTAYSPVLNLNDGLGCSVSYLDTVIIAANGVNANFSASPTEIYLDTEVTFEDASSSLSGNIIQWIWNFGDGRIDTLTNGNNVINQYVLGGDIVTTLTVMDDRGCKDQHSVILNVNNFHVGLNTVSQGLLKYGPNPTNDELIISFPSTENKTLSVNIYASNGLLVYKSKVVCQEKLNINTKNLQAGIYFIELNDPNLVSERLKIVKN